MEDLPTNVNIEKADLLYKLLLIGDQGVGKSSLLLRWIDDTFSTSTLTTIGVDFKIKTVKIAGSTIKLQIWDTAGQELFRNITTSYYRGAQAIIIVYDVTSLASFSHIDSWITEVEKNCHDKIDLLLVGNKADLESERKISQEEGKEKAKALNVDFLETSAKDKINVRRMFYKIAKQLLDKGIGLYSKITNEKEDIIVLSGGKVKKKKKRCCNK